MAECTYGEERYLRPPFWARRFIFFYIAPWWFTAPALLLVSAISIFPITVAIWWSFHSSRYALMGAWVGLHNYAVMFSQAARPILNSLTYVLGSLAIALPIGVGLAIALESITRGRAALRTILLLPWVLSQTTAALLWKWMANSSYGPAGYLISDLTQRRIDLLAHPATAFVTLVAANAWISYPIVVLGTTAALQTIPREVYESAAIDGAKGLTLTFRITLPIIRSSLASLGILLTLSYFNMVTLLYVLTGGGPLGATETLSLRAFKEGFEYWHFGIASAASVVIATFNLFSSVAWSRVTESP